MRLLPSLCILLLLGSPAYALVMDRALPDAAQEQQAQTLFHAMRCVVCEGQSLADSDATFAQQMRAQIRRMIAAGETPEDIRDYFTERYGARILMSPPLNADTLLLWGMPLLLIAAASWLLWPRRFGDKS